MASNEATLAPKRGACATMAVSMPGSRTSWVNRAAPVLLASESLRRTRSEPIRVKAFGSFSAGAWGGATLAASASRSLKLAWRLEAGWATTPSRTVISPAGAFHLAAAASTNIARAEAPAVRSCVQELEIDEDPPVPCTPIRLLA